MVLVGYTWESMLRLDEAETPGSVGCRQRGVPWAMAQREWRPQPPIDGSGEVEIDGSFSTSGAA